MGQQIPRDYHEPTMYLDLTHGGDDYKASLIRHIFGHVLGLKHEHQRSDFWRYIRPFVDVGMMRRELGDRFREWEPTRTCASSVSCPYDPDSIMHYV